MLRLPNARGPAFRASLKPPENLSRRRFLSSGFFSTLLRAARRFPCLVACNAGAAGNGRASLLGSVGAGPPVRRPAITNEAGCPVPGDGRNQQRPLPDRRLRHRVNENLLERRLSKIFPLGNALKPRHPRRQHRLLFCAWHGSARSISNRLLLRRACMDAAPYDEFFATGG